MRTAPAIALLGYLLAQAMASAATAEPIPRAEHPRPDLRRDGWQNLNGPWQFCFDPDDRGLDEQWPLGTGPFDRRIHVPFAWQSTLSGIGESSAQPIGWYRRTVDVPASWRGGRVWLCFGGVRSEARVWVNGRAAGRHEGGQHPFAFDITEFAPPGSEARLDVRVRAAADADLPADRHPYRQFPASSGIWQTVWLESRSPAYVDGLRLTPTRPGGRWILEVDVELAGSDGPVKVAVRSPDRTVSPQQGRAAIQGGRGAWRALLEIGDPKTWSPDQPHLYDLEVSVAGPQGQRDVVHTYFGLRTIARGVYGKAGHESILLNGEPLYLRGALDPSLNPAGLLTAPSDEFLRRDMQLARELGLNLLKVYGKIEEPRRLYWADTLGVLLWQEMPPADLGTEASRAAWQAAVREIIRRDRNHPALIGWTLFHDGPSPGGTPLQDDPVMQQWVRERVREVQRELDPSRLVEDNATSRLGAGTDVNTWQFRIDDYWIAREHIGHVVARARPDSPFARRPDPGGTAPLVCGQFAAAPAEGGDVSWGLRFLVTQLRRHSAIQGHILGAFYDVPWRHDGLLRFDRSGKEFGYNGFVPGMTMADLQGCDFVGFDAPPILETAPGEELNLALFASHYSGRPGPVTLRWQVVGVDDYGRPVAGSRKSRDISWQRGTVTYQTPLRVRVPEGPPFVGALTAELLDVEGRRLAANYVNLIADRTVEIDFAGEPQPAETLRPYVEVLAPRLVALRIPPREFAAFRAGATGAAGHPSGEPCSTLGNCEVEYRVALPDFVRDAIPTQMVLMAELAALSGAEPRRGPATHGEPAAIAEPPATYPGSVGVYLWDHELWQIPLPADPADSHGVLSHHARFRHGHYGELVRRRVDLTSLPSLREAVYLKESFPLVFRTEGPQTGLAIYGRQLGRYMIDPTLILQTAKQLDRPVGFVSYDPVTVDRLPK